MERDLFFHFSKLTIPLVDQQNTQEDSKMAMEILCKWHSYSNKKRGTICSRKFAFGAGMPFEGIHAKGEYIAFLVKFVLFFFTGSCLIFT